MKKPNIINKKRGAIYSVVAVMLSTAVYLNWSYTSTPNGELVSSEKHYGDSKLVDSITDGEIIQTSGVDNFSNAKITRQTARDQAISILNETINNENTSEEAKETATASVQSMSKYTVSEGAIETVMSAKGFSQSVVFISDDGVNVLVSKNGEEFTATDAAIIKDIVITETSVSADKIKIIESN